MCLYLVLCAVGGMVNRDGRFPELLLKTTFFLFKQIPSVQKILCMSSTFQGEIFLFEGEGV